MKRRRYLLLLGLLAGLFTLGAGAWLLWPRTAITPSNAERILPGMTQAEVEDILGGPARDEASDPHAQTPLAPNALETLKKHQGRRQNILLWRSDRVSIAVAFDFDGRVTNRIFVASFIRQEGLLDMLRRWLRL